MEVWLNLCFHHVNFSSLTNDLSAGDHPSNHSYTCPQLAAIPIHLTSRRRGSGGCCKVTFGVLPRIVTADSRLLLLPLSTSPLDRRRRRRLSSGSSMILLLCVGNCGTMVVDESNDYRFRRGQAGGKLKFIL